MTIRQSRTKSDCNRWSAKTATSEDVHIGASGNRELLTAADFDAHAKDDSAKVKLKNERNNEKIYFICRYDGSVSVNGSRTIMGKFRKFLIFF